MKPSILKDQPQLTLLSLLNVRIRHVDNILKSLNSTNLILFLDGTTIKSVSENIVTNPGDDATLSCSVDGKPLIGDHVRWERLGYNFVEKTKTKFVNGTSYLHIKNVQREDVGNFRCVADNRVANPTSRDVLLIVKCKFSYNNFSTSYFKL